MSRQVTGADAQGNSQHGSVFREWSGPAVDLAARPGQRRGKDDETQNAEKETSHGEAGTGGAEWLSRHRQGAFRNWTAESA
jgi:hypothetical protein